MKSRYLSERKLRVEKQVGSFPRSEDPPTSASCTVYLRVYKYRRKCRLTVKDVSLESECLGSDLSSVTFHLCGLGLIT